MGGSSKDRSNQGRYPCIVCSTQVTIHQKALQCDNCDEWTHFKCTPLTCDEYSNLAASSNDWYCGNCESVCGPVIHGLDDVPGSEPMLTGESIKRVAIIEEASSASGDEEDDYKEDGSGDHAPENSSVNPCEELLVLLEDDFIKNLGNLVDVLKLKFEQIHDMQQRNKQLETDNRNLRQQLSDKNEENQALEQRLAQQAEPQAEIRRLNAIIHGLRETLNGRCQSSVGVGRQAEALVDRQSRMATVLGRMTNFLSGLSDDLTTTDNFLPTPPSSMNGPSRPSSADSTPLSDPGPGPKTKKFKRT